MAIDWLRNAIYYSGQAGVPSPLTHVMWTRWSRTKQKLSRLQERRKSERETGRECAKAQDHHQSAEEPSLEGIPGRHPDPYPLALINCIVGRVLIQERFINYHQS